MCVSFDLRLAQRTDSSYLKAAQEGVVDHIGVVLFTHVLGTSPSPQVFVVTGCLGVLIDSSSNNPHDRTKEEKNNRDRGVVYGSLLSAPVAAFPVTPKYYQAAE